MHTSLSDRTLLLVDDEPNITSALRRMLRGEGYRLLTAQCGISALELVAAHDVHMVLSDQCMPGMTGTQLQRHVAKIAPQSVRMILSGQADMFEITTALTEGVISKFLTKPWCDVHLKSVIAEAFAQQVLDPA